MKKNTAHPLLFLSVPFSWSPNAEEYLHFEAFMSTCHHGRHGRRKGWLEK
jgi:hypothetical protein